MAVVAPFLGDLPDSSPTMSPDGSYIDFQLTRPKVPLTDAARPKPGEPILGIASNLRRVDCVGAGWSEPKRLGAAAGGADGFGVVRQDHPHRSSLIAPAQIRTCASNRRHGHVRVWHPSIKLVLGVKKKTVIEIEKLQPWIDWALARADRIDPSIGDVFVGGMRAEEN